MQNPPKNLLDQVRDADEWNRAVPLLELQEAIPFRGRFEIEMPLVQVWLGLLLNGLTTCQGSAYAIEQRGDFYETEQVWIVR